MENEEIINILDKLIDESYEKNNTAISNKTLRNLVKVLREKNNNE